jgi:DNA-binding MarR family transcriptional regulator
MSGEWLTPDEQRAWRTYLRMSALLPAHLGRQLQRDSRLSLPEYEVLVQLSEADRHRLRPYQLCKALSWEQSRLSHQLSRMERRGLVAREGCEDDGRGAFVTLREAGAAAIESAAPGHVATVRGAIFSRLTEDERASFEKACTAILGALAEQDQELLTPLSAPWCFFAVLGAGLVTAGGVGLVPGAAPDPLELVSFERVPVLLAPPPLPGLAGPPLPLLPSLPSLPAPPGPVPAVPGCGKYGGYAGSLAYSRGNCAAPEYDPVQTW